MEFFLVKNVFFSTKENDILSSFVQRKRPQICEISLSKKKKCQFLFLSSSEGLSVKEKFNDTIISLLSLMVTMFRNENNHEGLEEYVCCNIE